MLVDIKDVPPTLINAIIAAEDERFYQHSGIDYLGVARAAYANLVTGGRRQGASTITMQVARNFFLSSEKTLTRKLYEVLLAFKIEHSLSKDQILELYINQIYLGQRAYGFAAASQIYFGKSLDQLTLGEAAMLAALPKAPSSYNPIANPQRAKQRQQYVLRRMKELGYITDAGARGRAQGAHRGAQGGGHLRRAGGLRRRNGAPGGVRAVPGGRLQPRLPRLHHHPPGRPGGGRCRPCARACSSTTGGSAIAARKASSNSPADADEDDFEEALAERADDDDLRLALVLAATRAGSEGGAQERRARHGRAARACALPRASLRAHRRRSAASGAAR